MRDIRVNSSWNQETEISVIKVPFGKMRKCLHLDLAPDSQADGAGMTYTPDQARQLACHLMEAAHRAEKGVL